MSPQSRLSRISITSCVLFGLAICLCRNAGAQPAPTTLPAPAAARLPAALKDYDGLSEQAARYQSLATELKWRRVCGDLFKIGKDDHPQWRVAEVDQTSSDHTPVDARDAASKARVEKIGGRASLVFDIQKNGRGIIEVGPKVAVPFAVEFKAAILADAGGGIGLMVGPAGEGIGCLFTRGGNLICSEPENMVEPVCDSILAPVFEPFQTGKWYTIRVQVTHGTLSAWVDGKLVGNNPIGTSFDLNKPVQISIATYSSKAAFADVNIECYQRVENASASHIWSSVFGNQSPAQAKSRADELVFLLDDDDPKVRDGAERILRAMGNLALPSLRAVGKDASLEQAARAARLIPAIEHNSADDPAVPPDPVGPGDEASDTD